MNSKRKRINKTKKIRNRTKKVGGDPMTFEQAKEKLVLGAMRQQDITSREFRKCIEVIKENDMLNGPMTGTGKTLLMLYIEKPNFVKLLIDEGVDVNIALTSGDTALHYAVETKNIEVINYLINNGANVNARNGMILGFGVPQAIPLNHFLYNDENDKNVLEVIKILVDAGSELNNIDGFNGGILGHLLIGVEDLLKRNEERDWINLSNRLEKLYKINKMMKYLIEDKGADVNGVIEDYESILWESIRSWNNILDDYNYNAYWYNIIKEDQSDKKKKDQKKKLLEMKNLTKYLIEKGANINYVSQRDGSSIGHYLCDNLVDPELLDYLCSKGFNYSLTDMFGNNLFHNFAINTYTGNDYRVRNRWTKLAEKTFDILKKYGVNFDSINDDGETPLYKALDFFSNEINDENDPLSEIEILVLLNNIELLLKNGVNPYIRNEVIGNTSYDLIEELIENEEIDEDDRNDLQDSFETFKYIWVNSEGERAIFINNEELMKNEILLKLKTEENKDPILNGICNAYLLNREVGINYLNENRETLDGKSILEYVVLTNMKNDKGQTLLMYAVIRKVLILFNKIKEIYENNKRKKI